MFSLPDTSMRTPKMRDSTRRLRAGMLRKDKGDTLYGGGLVNGMPWRNPRRKKRCQNAFLVCTMQSEAFRSPYTQKKLAYSNRFI